MAALRPGIESEAPLAYPTRLNTRERKLLEAALKAKNVEDTFECAPVVSLINNADGTHLAEAAAAMVLGMKTDRAPYEVYLAAVESTGTAAYCAPRVSADGLELTIDADLTNGPTAVELTHGTTSRSRSAFTCGTSPAFFFEATIKVDDISDVTSLWMGFRKAEAYQADAESYDEAAAFVIDGGTANGQINIWTILNNGATSKTDTTLTDWGDGDEKTLRVEVDRNGRCTFSVDGSEPTVTKIFKFDADEVVLPFLKLVAETGDPGVSISSWKCGTL